ncbi:MAG: 2-oxo acid dehydrogenase subunit E2, partial [Armatimonadetes bacterium]
IVNPPQSTILATGSVSRDLVVDDAGAIRIRDRMPATVTADHRSLDGVAVARFLTSISEFLESDELSKEGST